MRSFPTPISPMKTGKSVVITDNRNVSFGGPTFSPNKSISKNSDLIKCPFSQTMDVQSPLNDNVTSSKGSLKMLEKAPKMKQGDDEISKVSFGTAKKRFGNSGGIVSPEKTGTSKFIGSYTKPFINNNLAVSPHVTTRRGSTGYFDPRMVPAPVLSSEPVKATEVTSVAKGNLGEIGTSKVLRTKHNNAAVTIQKIIRGNFGRKLATKRRLERSKIKAAISIQTVARAYIGKKLRHKHIAAARIQGLYRGWHSRAHSQVDILEIKLARIEKEKMKELSKIKAWKKQMKKEMRNEYRIRKARIDEENQQIQELFDNTNMTMEYLKRENNKMREKNETLKSAIEQLTEEHDMLSVQTLQVGKQANELTKNMKKVNNDNTCLVNALKEFKSHYNGLKALIAKRDEQVMYENRVGRLYMKTMQGIVLALQDKCIDDELVYKIEEMCLNISNDKYQSLDETERDLSECGL